MQKIVESSLDSSCYQVVQGGVSETTALLEQRWDKIFYTGSANVGTIVAQKAAETLTPVTLELGGLNPAIVTKNANLRIAARRLLWAKTMNAGQVCISQNYTLVDTKVLDAFISELKTAHSEFYPKGPRDTDDYGRIVNGRQWTRLTSLLTSSAGRIILGGESDKQDLYIAPTIILLSSPDDPLIHNESFGPFLPILPFSDLSTAINIVNSTQSTPLGLYPFGTRAETDQILSEIRSGGASINDGFIHGSIPTLAFGGVGESGQGAYRGRASFDCFSHRRSITSTPTGGWMEKLMGVRYPPYEGKLAQFRRMTEVKPDFDREGNVKRAGLIGYILSLGAESKVSGFVRYVVLILGELCDSFFFLLFPLEVVCHVHFISLHSIHASPFCGEEETGRC